MLHYSTPLLHHERSHRNRLHKWAVLRYVRNRCGLELTHRLFADPNPVRVTRFVNKKTKVQKGESISTAVQKTMKRLLGLSPVIF